ncbi:MAG TPA: hypothetical protein VFO14_18995 [Vicinamibacterales bacterium]|nr:hypothetical protein [Vicinamibacterales bacterium]
MVLWGLVVLAVLVAVVALMRVRSLARRLELLNQSYWELRYDYTRLRSSVARLDPEQADAEPESPPAAAQPPSVSFVPLASLKRKE